NATSMVSDVLFPRVPHLVMLLSSDGQARENNRVFPFGEPWLSFMASNNNEKFTTYDRDSETGNDYAMARFYASRDGRFMSPDPGHIGADPTYPQSWNAYTYGLNDPINNIDPDGSECVNGVNPETGNSPRFTILASSIFNGTAYSWSAANPRSAV